MAIVFSEYEQEMIGFLMGYGMAEDLAEQSVVDERIDQFGDMHHQLTAENQRRDYAPMQMDGYPQAKTVPSKKIQAFRALLGEETWRRLRGHLANPELLERAIDFKYEE